MKGFPTLTLSLGFQDPIRIALFTVILPLTETVGIILVDDSVSAHSTTVDDSFLIEPQCKHDVLLNR